MICSHADPSCPPCPHSVEHGPIMEDGSYCTEPVHCPVVLQMVRCEKRHGFCIDFVQ